MSSMPRIFIAVSALLAVTPSSLAQTAPYACGLLETQSFLPELRTFSGYRWIECRVIGPTPVDVEGVAVNNGNCQTFDYWYARRRFTPGEVIDIPYACMSPVKVSIAANGAIFHMKLR